MTTIDTNTEVIPFNRPGLESDELDLMAEAIKSGVSSAKGPFSKLAASILVEETGAADVLLTTSCTAALEMSAMLLDLQPGDNVIVPSFTFVTTALAFQREGATLRFADIERDQLGLDPASVESLIDERTRAVVPVHYAGIAADLNGLSATLADRGNIDIIEDNAHGLFGRFSGKPLGSFGRFSTLSFHETKNFVCGEGGALVINDPADVARAHILYDKGTNRREFLLGQVDKYSWVDKGSSFGLSDLLAAYLYGQLKNRNTILAKRRAVFDRYEASLAPRAAELGFTLPSVSPERQQAYHMFFVLMSSRQRRDAVLAKLSEVGVRATFHYVPLHSAAGSQFTDRPTPCPVTDDISGRLLRLPFFNDLSQSDSDRVIEAFLHAAEATL